MYAGSPTVQVVSFDAPAADFTLLPANARLQTGTPPAGSPNYFASSWNFTNALSVYKFHVDWNSISTSTFTGPFISIAPASWANSSAAVPACHPSAATASTRCRSAAMMQNQYTQHRRRRVAVEHPHGRRRAPPRLAAVRFYQVNVTGGTVAAERRRRPATYNPDANACTASCPASPSTARATWPSATAPRAATTNPAIKYAGRLCDRSGQHVHRRPRQSLIQGTGTQIRQLRQPAVHPLGRLQRDDARSRRLHVLVHERVLPGQRPEPPHAHRLVHVSRRAPRSAPAHCRAP